MLSHNRQSYEMRAIGKIKLIEMQVVIELEKDYIKGLKYLGLFSHAIIIFDKDEQSEVPFYEQVVKIIKVEESVGKVYLEAKNDLTTQGRLFDIKPYFPCEDRVRLSSGPKHKEIDEDARDKHTSEVKNGTIEQESFLYEKGEDNHDKEIVAIGQIRKLEEKCYLYFKEASSFYFEQLKKYSHIKVFWWFNRFDKPHYRQITLCQPPYENAPKTGVFASRSPVRPNPIALTTTRIIQIEEELGRIQVSHLDCFDHTPLVEVKPYCKEEDYIELVNVPSWLIHWPSFLEEEAESMEEIRLMPSSLDLLKQWITKEEEKSVNKTFLHTEKNRDYAQPQHIVVQGVRQNNLKHIDVSIPYGKITAISGVSGSGKSSLAFDTLYAESQRRLISSMGSGYLSDTKMDKPDADDILGLPPSIAISQKGSGSNPRSTVGTLTGLYDYLQAIFAGIGIRHCPKCGNAIIPISEDEIISKLKLLIKKTYFQINPFQLEKNIFYIEQLTEEVEEQEALEMIETLKKSVQQALKIGKGAIEITIPHEPLILMQTTEMCYHCQHILFELTPSTFSFNGPLSMCPVCKGLGKKLEPSIAHIVSEPNKSVLDGASAWWGNLRKFRDKPNANWMKGEILALAKAMKVEIEKPRSEPPEALRKKAIWGSGEEKVSYVYQHANGRSGEINRPVEGAYYGIKRYFLEGKGESASRLTQMFMHEEICPACRGERLLKEGRMVTVGDKRFPEVARMSICELIKYIEGLEAQLTSWDLSRVGLLLNELYQSLQGYVHLGLSYLTLDRAVPTLSGGEWQRLRLMTQLKGDMTNILYVLDEPSMGLHPKDYEHLLYLLRQLRDKGNTIVMVEHNEDMLKAADYLIDMGPGAGVNGGEILALGTVSQIMSNERSITGQYLSKKKQVYRNRKDIHQATHWINLKGIQANNLKHIDITFPTEAITCVCGVSGSGKSTLVNQVLYLAVQRQIKDQQNSGPHYEGIEGAEGFSQIIKMDQKPIGKSPRSNPATLLGIMEEIRGVFANTQLARERKYKENFFSFNTKEGGCSYCHGAGRICTPIAFMADIWSECPVCKGKRYNKEVLDVKYREKNISEVLEMYVQEAYDFFNGTPKIQSLLGLLIEVGLGYLKLGQSATTLSGGEAQRLKLAKELVVSEKGKTLYLLDEPTTGLHFLDIAHLLKLLEKLVKAGNSVIIIEHNMDMIKNADWLIDLGPEGGDKGGYVLTQGTPLEVARIKESYTGNIIKRAILP